MPLRDHFHPPLSNFCPWGSFHSNWSVKMVDELNARYFASRKYTAQSGHHFGAHVEADVATLERVERGSLFAEPNGTGGVATTATVFSPPATTLSAVVKFDDPDLFEVKVYRGPGGWELVAAVELVSQANKDSHENRRAFVVKCGSYLQKGISLVVVDTVTTYSADLHGELCDLIEGADPLRWSSPSGLSVVAYRPTRTSKTSGPALDLEVFPYPVGIGEKLPSVPLWLSRDLAVPLELELTYRRACESLQIE